MSCTLTIKVNSEDEEVMERLRQLSKLEAACGYQSDGGAGYDEGNGSADIVDIAIWNEYGTYASPPRPFMTNAIESYGGQIDEMAREVAIEVGDGGSAEEGLNQLGNFGKSAVQMSITDGGYAPNAPITVTGGYMHNKKSGKLFRVRGKGSNQPLIDTGRLRNSVTYEVRAKTTD